MSERSERTSERGRAVTRTTSTTTPVPVPVPVPVPTVRTQEELA